MKKFNNTIGNRTHGLLGCSSVPQPSAPPRAPLITLIEPFQFASSIRGGMIEDPVLQGYDAASLGNRLPVFQRNMVPSKRWEQIYK